MSKMRWKNNRDSPSCYFFFCGALFVASIHTCIILQIMRSKIFIIESFEFGKLRRNENLLNVWPDFYALLKEKSDIQICKIEIKIYPDSTLILILTHFFSGSQRRFERKIKLENVVFSGDDIHFRGALKAYLH